MPLEFYSSYNIWAMRRISKILVAVSLGLGIAAASYAMAAKPTDNTRPGWGFGDKNHVHTGPPGQSVHP